MDETRRAALQSFFERYAIASRAGDPGALAVMYAPSFIAGGPQGSRCFANDARFVEWLERVDDFNREHGMRAIEVVAIDPIALSPVHSLAIVRWGARFERTGDRLIEFQIAYLLEETAGSAKILSYISETDQQEAMRAHGLL